MDHLISRNAQRLKKNCVSCYQSPENVIVLACQHAVCLNCANNIIKNQISILSYAHFQFKCSRCKQKTLFDQELINQIQSNINIQSSSYLDSIPLVLDINKDQNNNKHSSFIQKMKKQYFTQQLKQQAETKVQYTSIKKRQSIQSVYKKTKNMRQNQEKSLQINKNEDKILQISRQKDRITCDLINNNQKCIKRVSQTSVYQVQNSSNYQDSLSLYCVSHQGYQLLYYCLKCDINVCSQCLLRGSHHSHQNQSFNKFFQSQLPNFLNISSEQLIKKISCLQKNQEDKENQIFKKIQDIQRTKHDAKLYFQEMRMKINIEENQVLAKCNMMVQKCHQQQQQLKFYMQQKSHQLYQFVGDIKTMKQDYKQYLDSLQFLHLSIQKLNRKRNLQRKLIKKFINNSKGLKKFVQKLAKNQNQTKLLKYDSYESSLQSLRESIKIQPANKISQKDKYISYISKTEDSHLSTQNTKQLKIQIKNPRKQISPSLSPYKPDQSVKKKQRKLIKQRKATQSCEISNKKQNQAQNYQHKASEVKNTKGKEQANRRKPYNQVNFYKS